MSLRAREQCTSAAVNRGELEIVLPVDYEIQGKCTYVCKKQDGVAPSSKHVELKIIIFYLFCASNQLSVASTFYLRKTTES